MRYKKGNKVEVLSKSEVPSGSWRCAQIICGNGHNYTVKYDVHSGVTNEVVVERVSRKSIRPCPPPVELLENYIPGDVVEVFHNFSWKMATVSKVLGRNYFLVRLVGLSHEFKVSKFDLRMRQSLQDDKWIRIGKGLGNHEGGKHNERSTLWCNNNSSFQVQQTDSKMNIHVKEHCFAAQNNLQESRIVSSRTLKRGSPCCYSRVGACEGSALKFRVIETEGRRHGVLTAIQSSSPENVDAAASARGMPGEKHIHTSFYNGTTHFSDMDVESEKPNGAFGCSCALGSEHDDADSITCSVGSCTINSNNPYKLPCHSGPVEDIDGHYSDAESLYRLGYEEGICLPPPKEELAAEIHRLELHAYRCTIEALHASGPLSWEQESLMTNLRISLHISNDEHLMELRNLVSTATSIPIS